MPKVSVPEAVRRKNYPKSMIVQRLTELGMSTQVFTKRIGMPRSTLYSKWDNPERFTREDILKMKSVLEWSDLDVLSFIYAKEVKCLAS